MEHQHAFVIGIVILFITVVPAGGMAVWGLWHSFGLGVGLGVIGTSLLCEMD